MPQSEGCLIWPVTSNLLNPSNEMLVLHGVTGGLSLSINLPLSVPLGTSINSQVTEPWAQTQANDSWVNILRILAPTSFVSRLNKLYLHTTYWWYYQGQDLGSWPELIERRWRFNDIEQRGLALVKRLMRSVIHGSPSFSVMKWWIHAYLGWTWHPFSFTICASLTKTRDITMGSHRPY